MASQSPAGEEPKREYQNAWSSLRRIILEDGASLSGRERNFVYLNRGDGQFADVSEISDANAIGDARALGLTDWDDDGRLDLILRNRTAPRLQIFRNQAAQSGKPEKVIEKIVSGKVEKFFSETCLVEQEFIKDSQITVTKLIEQVAGKVGSPIEVTRFVRMQLGDASEA